MKTTGVFYAGEETVSLMDFELPAPDLYEVQIELKASALCAWDQAIYKGTRPGDVEYPFLHGHEGVGVVTAVGSRVEGFEPGDLVAAMGNDSKLLGHHANVPQQYVAKLEPDVTDYENWIAEPVACVMNGLEWSKLLPGDRVAVVGTGFMGLLFVQGLAHALVSEIIAMDIEPVRLGLAQDFGADQIINLATDEGKQAAAELAENPVDVMVEVAGAQPAFDLNYSLIRRGGRLNVFSWHKGGDRRVDLGAWHGMGLEVVNASPSIAPDFSRVFARTVPMMERGVFDLEPLITHVVSPEEAPELFETAAHQDDGYIKGVIRW
jgi:threonine dehydrogenase-like Zn-dependent dehydrogenase